MAMHTRIHWRCMSSVSVYYYNYNSSPTAGNKQLDHNNARFSLNLQKKKHKKSKKDKEEAPAADEGEKKEGGGKRAQRATSNVFGMFPQQQIQEFKEVC